MSSTPSCSVPALTSGTGMNICSVKAAPISSYSLLAYFNAEITAFYFCQGATRCQTLDSHIASLLSPVNRLHSNIEDGGWNVMRRGTSGKSRRSTWHFVMNEWADHTEESSNLSRHRQTYSTLMSTSLKNLKVITLFTKKHLSWIKVVSDTYLIQVNNRCQVTNSGAVLSHKGL